MTRRATDVATWCRVAAAAAACAAAFGPTAGRGDGDATRVLLVDVSASVGGRAATEDELRALTDGASRGDTCVVVAFADGAARAGGPASARDLVVGPAALAPWATSLAAGLRAALAERRPGTRLHVLLATDARVTDDAASLERAAAAVRAAGGADVTWLRRESVAPAPVVHALRGPGRAAVGETVVLEASGAAGAGGATVLLLARGEVLETRRVEGDGAFRVAFARTADAPGEASWEARTAEAPDVPPAVARVVVVAPGATAYVHGGAARAAVADAVRPLGAVVDVRASGAAGLAAALTGHDAVVADGVTGSAEVAALRAFAQAGGGVVLVGAERAAVAPRRDGEGFGPLRDAPPDAGGVALYLAIDGSGSMGEPWPGAGDALPRDVAVRAAADALLRAAPRGTHVALRRFRERVVPDGVPPARLDLADDASRDAARAAVARLPSPGGSTAFLPVLAEAADVLAARPEETRVAMFLTDGRSGEDAAALAAAAERLRAAGARIAVVVPGRSDDGAGEASLLRALQGTGAVVRAARDPARLAEVLVGAARDARSPDAFVEGAALALADGLGGAVRAEDAPSRATRLVRAWAADGATTVVRTGDGVPAAAVVREGAGRVAALAAPAPDAAWLPDDGGARLLAALVRAVRRPASSAVRVEVSGTTLTARVDGAAAPRRVRVGEDGGDVPLVALGGGLFTAELPARATLRDARAVTFLGEDGTPVAAAALDRPSPAEVLPPAPIDVDALAARLRPAAAPPGAPLAPWLAAAAVLLLVAGSAARLQSHARPAR